MEEEVKEAEAGERGRHARLVEQIFRFPGGGCAEGKGIGHASNPVYVNRIPGK